MRFLISFLLSVFIGLAVNAQTCFVDWKFSTQSLNQQYLMRENVLLESYHDGDKYVIEAPLGLKGIRSNTRSSNLKCLLPPGDTIQIDISGLPYDVVTFELLNPVVFSSSNGSDGMDSMDMAIYEKLQVAKISDGNRMILDGYNDNGRTDSIFSNDSFGSNLGDGNIDDNINYSNNSRERNFLFMDSSIQIIEIVNKSESFGFGFDVSPLINISGEHLPNKILGDFDCSKGFSILFDVSASVDSSECSTLLSQIQQSLQVFSGTDVEFEIISFAEDYSVIYSMSNVDSVLNEWSNIDSMINGVRANQGNGAFTTWPMSYIKNTDRAMFFLVSDGFNPRNKSRAKKLLEYHSGAKSIEFMSKNVVMYAFHELAEYPTSFFKFAFDNDLNYHLDTLYRKTLYQVNDINDQALSLTDIIVDHIPQCGTLALHGIAIDEENGEGVILYTRLNPRLFDGKGFSRKTKIVQGALDPSKFPSLTLTNTPLNISEGENQIGRIDVYKWREKPTSSKQVSLYPNPGRDRFNLKAMNEARISYVKIVNSDGKLIKDAQTAPVSEYEFVLSNVPSGFYTANISLVSSKTEEEVSISFIKL